MQNNVFQTCYILAIKCSPIYLRELFGSNNLIISPISFIAIVLCSSDPHVHEFGWGQLLPRESKDNPQISPKIKDTLFPFDEYFSNQCASDNVGVYQIYQQEFISYHFYFHKDSFIICTHFCVLLVQIFSTGMLVQMISNFLDIIV